MEGLRAQGYAALAELDFVREPKEHELITVTAGNSINVSRVFMPVSDIAFSCAADATTAPSLRLAKINVRNKDPSRPWRCFNASRDEIIQLWNAFEMEPYQLYL